MERKALTKCDDAFLPGGSVFNVVEMTHGLKFYWSYTELTWRSLELYRICGRILQQHFAFCTCSFVPCAVSQLYLQRVFSPFSRGTTIIEPVLVRSLFSWALVIYEPEPLSGSLFCGHDAELVHW